jgi:hypothetical protein
MCATAAVGDGATLQPGVDDHRDTALAHCSASPMPECIRIVGLWTVLANSTTSPGHDRLEALVHQLDADSPLVLDEDANDSLAGEKGHAARGQVRTGISVYPTDTCKEFAAGLNLPATKVNLNP